MKVRGQRLNLHCPPLFDMVPSCSIAAYTNELFCEHPRKDSLVSASHLSRVTLILQTCITVYTPVCVLKISTYGRNKNGKENEGKVIQ